ncbi:phosphotyrosine protein phosphatase [Parasphingorhabdus sp.]|uniref:phosphotyrosine protein phosphatase n=1 Tax=Parasphingorhabdus sp. TaxID=2709688 RepID=UPI0032677CE2
MEAISAGTNNDAETTVSGDLIEWADNIYVMERKHHARVTQTFAPLLKDKPVRVLGIPDDFKYMDPGLVDLLKRKFPEWFS